MKRTRVGLFLLGALGAGYSACVSAGNPIVTPDGGSPPSFDASDDGAVGQDGASSADAGHDATTDARDAAIDDAGDATLGSDAQADAPSDAPKDVQADMQTDAPIDAPADVQADAPVDAQPDAPTDAADAAPLFDDAGCPLPTGVVADPADAGLPSTGIALWLRADLGLATMDGGSVCRWDDVSGNARAFVPGTSTPPVVDPTGISGKPSVTFTANGTWLVRNDVLGLGATSGRTFAAYGSSADTTHRHQYVFQAAPSSPGTYAGFDTNTYFSAGSREGVYVANNSFDSNITTSTTPHSYILSIASLVVGSPLPAGLVYTIDGTDSTLTLKAGSGAVEDFSSANTTWLGTATDPAFTTGDLAEVIVYDHALSVSERAAVAQYFQGRYP